MIPENIKNKIGRNLYEIPNHLLCVIKELIYSQFSNFQKFERFSPEVSVEDNFNSLLIPENHSSRSKSDTFYIDGEKVLRTHTSAHQNYLLKLGWRKFLVCGDVYRKDEIDKNHYPVFHQIEGVSLGENSLERLKEDLSKLINSLFPNCNYKFVDSYFPFTEPSFEIEVFYNGAWLEILGCGKIHTQILKNCNIEGEGYAFGLGLERLAMVLFDIPDIRYFWSEDERFLSQFAAGTVSKFKPYSKYPPVYKDISFWIPDDFSSNSLFLIIRNITGDLIEDVSLIDTFVKNDKTSNTFRLSFRSLDRTLTDDEINRLYFQIRHSLTEEGYNLR